MSQLGPYIHKTHHNGWQDVGLWVWHGSQQNKIQNGSSIMSRNKKIIKVVWKSTTIFLIVVALSILNSFQSTNSIIWILWGVWKKMFAGIGQVCGRTSLGICLKTFNNCHQQSTIFAHAFLLSHNSNYYCMEDVLGQLKTSKRHWRSRRHTGKYFDD